MHINMKDGTPAPFQSISVLSLTVPTDGSWGVLKGSRGVLVGPFEGWAWSSSLGGYYGAPTTVPK